MGRRQTDSGSINFDLAAVVRIASGKNPSERAFTSPVLANEPVNLAGLNLEVNGTQNSDRAE
jgi:hypothetical protein